ncbi:hypothetical protein [Snuella sedimenti]|uniref:Uncharacterized protein n=1 Tax=Snuella sedimenti TaxID=2798802 RepID=A0A8J7J1B1_9FLAO|nr:hypothetical protein [Snuella sedimenti]MBJ6367822.1 hypothetical protein [Snuella sedimenti]
MKKVKIGGLVLLSLIIVVEITLRLCCYEKLRKWKGNEYVKDEKLGYRYRANYEGYFINVAYKNKYKVNSSGFIWDEFIEKKESGMFRILLLGNSDDTGINSDGFDCYPRLLQKKFKENGDNIEIMNLSLDGATRAIRELNFAYECATKYNPDMILINARYPITDRVHAKSTYRGVSIISHHYHESLKETEAFIDSVLDNTTATSLAYDYSYIFRYICKVYLERPNYPLSTFLRKHILKNRRVIEILSGRLIGHLEAKPGGMYHKDYTKEESLEIYLEASDSLERMNAKLVLFNKYIYPINNKELKPYLKNYWPLNVKFKPEYSFGKYDMHSSQKGHKAIFEMFYRKLYTDEIVPEKYFSEKSKNEIRNIEKELQTN